MLPLDDWILIALVALAAGGLAIIVSRAIETHRLERMRRQVIPAIPDTVDELLHRWGRA